MPISMQEYFTNIVNKVLTSVGCTIDISINIYDHSTLKGKAKKALGICWKSEEGYFITIDEFFLEECYKYFELNSNFSTWELGTCRTLESVICHELAHLRHWNHTKKHTELMNSLLSKVEQPERYYRYLDKNAS